MWRIDRQTLKRRKIKNAYERFPPAALRFDFGQAQNATRICVCVCVCACVWRSLLSAPKKDNK